MTRPPRILRVITRLNVGGPATHVTVADRGLRARGWETLLAFGSVEPDEMEIDVDGLDLPLARLPGLARPIHPLHDLRAAVAIASLIRRHRPDVIHSHLSKAGLIARGVALATSRAVRVHTFHGTVFGGYFGERASASIVRAERFLGARSHALVALSPRQRQELLDNRIARDDRIHVIPLGLPLDKFAAAGSAKARAAARRRLDIPPGTFAIVAVGRIVPIKRLDRLLHALALVVRDVPRAHLYLVGGGSARPALERDGAWDTCLVRRVVRGDARLVCWRGRRRPHIGPRGNAAGVDRGRRSCTPRCCNRCRGSRRCRGRWKDGFRRAASRHPRLCRSARRARSRAGAARLNVGRGARTGRSLLG
jgi:glycosyltransferase involved in cell wall biosynthesis